MLLLFRHSVMSDSLKLHGLQHTRLPCPSPSPGVCSNLCSLDQWCHPPSHPLSSLSPPALNLSWHQDLFQWVSSSHQVAQVLELQHQSFQWVTVLICSRIDWFALCAVQATLKSLLQHHKFENISCLAFSLLYGPTLTSYMTTGKTTALTRQSNLCFLIRYLGLSLLFFQGTSVF